MNAIESWNGGVIIISHDERFINTIAKEVSPKHLPSNALIGHPSSGCAQRERSTSTRETYHRTRYGPTLQNKGSLNRIAEFDRQPAEEGQTDIVTMVYYFCSTSLVFMYNLWNAPRLNIHSTYTLALTTSLVRDAAEPQACSNLENQSDRVAQCLRLTTTFSSRSVVAPAMRVLAANLGTGSHSCYSSATLVCPGPHILRNAGSELMGDTQAWGRAVYSSGSAMMPGHRLLSPPLASTLRYAPLNLMARG